ncbi:ankyrin repeat-containing protein At5g02620-like isoform X3 [Phaseolus vulgaris]|uniref:ankyrin repeat-containing protein At5g02620-like isoform X3 n=1 Tax=Phaseolus vulgaris TaxID=3885 RepID=UPI0035CC1138
MTPQITKPENGKELDILIHRTEDSRSLPELNKTQKRKIYTAAASGDLSKASSCDSDIHPYWWRIPLNDFGTTALHVAMRMEKTAFVEELVKHMKQEDMEKAFSLAAKTGNVKIAELLLKNENLLWIRDQNDMLPMQLASSAGHVQMIEFLFKKTSEELLKQKLSFPDIKKLLFFTINNNIDSVTSKLLRISKKFVDEERLTAWERHDQYLYKDNVRDQDSVGSVCNGMEKVCNEMEKEKDTISAQLSKAMFNAAKSGNTNILTLLLEDYPDMLFEVNSRKQSLLHIAILHRQKYIYRLILEKDVEKVMTKLVDSKGNNVLHLAGEMKQAEKQSKLSTHHVLMNSEEKWFQNVENIVPSAMKTMRNKEGLTPKELFYKRHEELHKESISGLQAKANTLLVVATLVITLGITAGMTVPVQNIDGTRTPFFSRKIWYTFFFLSLAFGTCCCVSSMFFYASVILPQSWTTPKEESVRLQQTKLVFGNVSLFGSLALMFTALVSGCVLIFEFLSSWILYFIFALGLVVLVVHLTLDYNRWIGILHSVLDYLEDAPPKWAPILWPIHEIIRLFLTFLEKNA